MKRLRKNFRKLRMSLCLSVQKAVDDSLVLRLWRNILRFVNRYFRVNGKSLMFKNKGY